MSSEQVVFFRFPAEQRCGPARCGPANDDVVVDANETRKSNRNFVTFLCGPASHLAPPVADATVFLFDFLKYARSPFSKRMDSCRTRNIRVRHARALIVRVGNRRSTRLTKGVPQGMCACTALERNRVPKLGCRGVGYPAIRRSLIQNPATGSL